MNLIERAGLSAMWLHVKLAWFKRARSEMSAAHPDTPYVVLSIAHLEAQLEGKM
jgi:hypothetical protein